MDDISDEDERGNQTQEELEQENTELMAAILASAAAESAVEEEFGDDFHSELNSILLEKGHLFSESHVKARYQYVIQTSDYITPPGLVVVPCGNSKPSVCRRFKQYTVQIVNFAVCRFRVKPELPAVDASADKTLIGHKLHGKSVTVLADGKTLVFTMSGEYRYLLDEDKDPTETSTEWPMPNNPALDPDAAAWTVTVEEFLEDSVP